MRRGDGGWAWVTALCLCGVVAGASGCAAAPAAAPTTAAPGSAKEESREPATIEEAQAQLEQARAQLAGQAPAGPSAAGTGATVESSVSGGATSAAESPPPSKCGNACGAVSSMRRAVDAICRLAGDADARCTDARKTLKDGEAKVTGCGCPPP
ncbi:MAG TPA: hypothetical protein VGL81_12105 [Polyangiaceae bacterium]|jgi:hypothetical protein